MNRPLVVIGHRMGKGQRIAAGVEEAGGTAHVIEGMLADMKLGDVMHEMNADIGLSFYKQYQRTTGAFAQCIKEGCQVVGGPFMDNEELGREVVKAWKETHEQ